VALSIVKKGALGVEGGAQATARKAEAGSRAWFV
jgi:hypothetical protein